MRLTLLTMPFSTTLWAAPGDPPELPVCADAPERLQPLCTTYCEDLDCDSELPEDPLACDRVLQGYQRLGDGALPPCLGGEG